MPTPTAADIRRNLIAGSPYQGANAPSAAELLSDTELAKLTKQLPKNRNNPPDSIAQPLANHAAAYIQLHWPRATYRASSDPSLPTAATINRLYHSWPQAIAQPTVPGSPVAVHHFAKPGKLPVEENIRLWELRYAAGDAFTKQWEETGIVPDSPPDDGTDEALAAREGWHDFLAQQGLAGTLYQDFRTGGSPALSHRLDLLMGLKKGTAFPVAADADKADAALAKQVKANASRQARSMGYRKDTMPFDLAVARLMADYHSPPSEHEQRRRDRITAAWDDLTFAKTYGADSELALPLLYATNWLGEVSRAALPVWGVQAARFTQELHSKVIAIQIGRQFYRDRPSRKARRADEKRLRILFEVVRRFEWGLAEWERGSELPGEIWRQTHDYLSKFKSAVQQLPPSEYENPEYEELLELDYHGLLRRAVRAQIDYQTGEYTLLLNGGWVAHRRSGQAQPAIATVQDYRPGMDWLGLIDLFSRRVDHPTPAELWAKEDPRKLTPAKAQAWVHAFIDAVEIDRAMRVPKMPPEWYIPAHATLNRLRHKDIRGAYSAKRYAELIGHCVLAFLDIRYRTDWAAAELRLRTAFKIEPIGTYRKLPVSDWLDRVVIERRSAETPPEPPQFYAPPPQTVTTDAPPPLPRQRGPVTEYELELARFEARKRSSKRKPKVLGLDRMQPLGL